MASVDILLGPKTSAKKLDAESITLSQPTHLPQNRRLDPERTLLWVLYTPVMPIDNKIRSVVRTVLTAQHVFGYEADGTES